MGLLGVRRGVGAVRTNFLKKMGHVYHECSPGLSLYKRCISVGAPSSPQGCLILLVSFLGVWHLSLPLTPELKRKSRPEGQGLEVGGKFLTLQHLEGFLAQSQSWILFTQTTAYPFYR